MTSSEQIKELAHAIDSIDHVLTQVEEGKLDPEKIKAMIAKAKAMAANFMAQTEETKLDPEKIKAMIEKAKAIAAKFMIQSDETKLDPEKIKAMIEKAKAVAAKFMAEESTQETLEDVFNRIQRDAGAFSLAEGKAYETKLQDFITSFERVQMTDDE
eukprot:CAMPEP_0170540734 /NCGR_PEP_ID=MMETSP0211-20121228/679_1 /TAXON_ID=311385 /ORGANISM="Pseudokeronopsis sp., Strain OXSARD2" /LENGTH=156 /DNA_ID=CAMNT_0010843247 /DNA_START=143 /DNA_END=613 /DNA_ORIENTATION=+